MPLLITLLITKLSGLPPLARIAEQKWGGLKEWKEYKENTAVLIP